MILLLLFFARTNTFYEELPGKELGAWKTSQNKTKEPETKYILIWGWFNIAL